MAIMNKHMPLAKDEHGNKTRLKYAFSGEKTQYGDPVEVDDIDERTGVVKGKIWISKVIKPSTRKVLVSGRMLGETDVLEYESPTVFNIKNKKSPLWVEDEDQQLRYWSSRRWQRAHWPEGLLGIYDTDDAAMMHIGADNAKLIEASDKPGQALLERITAAKVQTDDADKITGVTEGFSKDHAANETKGVTIEKTADGMGTIITNNTDQTVYIDPEKIVETKSVATTAGVAVVASLEPKEVKKKNTKAAKDKAPVEEPKPEQKAEPEKAATEPELETEPLPKNVAEWQVYCLAWIRATPAAELQKRWDNERKLRNACGVTEQDRDKVFDELLAKRDG